MCDVAHKYIRRYNTKVQCRILVLMCTLKVHIQKLHIQKVHNTEGNRHTYITCMWYLNKKTRRREKKDKPMAANLQIILFLFTKCVQVLAVCRVPVQVVVNCVCTLVSSVVQLILVLLHLDTELLN